MNIPQDFLGEIINEAKEDEVGLWFVIGRVRGDLRIEDPLLLREISLRCVKELLNSGTIVAGCYRPDGSGIEVWDMEPESIVSRIDMAWSELGREPNIGEIVVFRGGIT